MYMVCMVPLALLSETQLTTALTHTSILNRICIDACSIYFVCEVVVIGISSTKPPVIQHFELLIIIM